MDLIINHIKIFIIAALPVIELKGAIPVATAMNLNIYDSFVTAFLGSMLPVPFLLLLVKPIFLKLRNFEFGRRIVNKFELKSLHNRERVNKYGMLAILLFVAFPLPGTGVWSGSIIAAILDIRFKRAFPAILVGNLIAGIIMLILSQGIKWVI